MKNFCSEKKASQRKCISLLETAFLLAFAITMLNQRSESTASRPRIENPRTQQHQKAFKNTRKSISNPLLWISARQKGAPAKSTWSRARAKLQDWWSICAFNYLFVFKIQGLRVGEPAPQTLLAGCDCLLTAAALVGRLRGGTCCCARNGGALPRTMALLLCALSFHFISLYSLAAQPRKTIEPMRSSR